MKKSKNTHSGTGIRARARKAAPSHGKIKRFLRKALFTFSDGLSILLSMVLITVIVLFSIGVTTLVIDSARQSANVKDGTTAYYAAEAGLEQALWINRELDEAGEAIGAEESGDSDLGTANTSATFKIQGSSENLLEKTVNGKLIVPFPWTGEVPWTGQGAVPGAGGCDPENPPLRTGGGSAKIFNYPGVTSPYNNEIEHPCNWGKLGVGEKVSIPLYGFDTNDVPVSIDDFKVRVRMPCKDGAEFCMPTDRMLLNCWDKGSGEDRCILLPPLSNNNYRGEVIVLWQIDAEKSGGAKTTLMPFSNDDTIKYLADDSQLYESKINTQQNSIKTFEVLNTLTSGFPTPYPKGKEIASSNTQYVKDFIIANTEPTLTLSVVSSLVGCKVPNDCISSVDNPENNSTYEAHMIPYIEYQIVIEDDVVGHPPASKDNIISAEGQSGPFNQTIQVKVPHDNSSLEYVIQQ